MNWPAWILIVTEDNGFFSLSMIVVEVGCVWLSLLECQMNGFMNVLWHKIPEMCWNISKWRYYCRMQQSFMNMYYNKSTCLICNVIAATFMTSHSLASGVKLTHLTPRQDSNDIVHQSQETFNEAIRILKNNPSIIIRCGSYQWDINIRGTSHLYVNSARYEHRFRALILIVAHWRHIAIYTWVNIGLDNSPWVK